MRFFHKLHFGEPGSNHQKLYRTRALFRIQLPLF